VTREIKLMKQHIGHRLANSCTVDGEREREGIGELYRAP